MHEEPSNFPDNDAYVEAVHDKGLAFDLQTMSRRKMFAAIGGAGLLAVTGGWLRGADPAAAACAAEIESETAGPFPADGTNGPNVRTTSGVVRSDIRPSFGGATGVADGIPLTIKLTVLNTRCAPLVGAAVYLWHCDRLGRYSLYSSGATNQNYLRGIQTTDSTGALTFTSIFPACYPGRWPHAHFEVYSSLANATSGAGRPVKTSQIALPQSTCASVYATSAYSSSVAPFSRISLATDGVFRDDLAAREMATVSGSVTAGFVASLAVTVNA